MKQTMLLSFSIVILPGDEQVHAYLLSYSEPMDAAIPHRTHDQHTLWVCFCTQFTEKMEIPNSVSV